MDIENLLKDAYSQYLQETNELLDEDLPGKHKSAKLYSITDKYRLYILRNLDYLATVNNIDLNRKGITLTLNGKTYKVGIA